MDEDKKVAKEQQFGNATQERDTYLNVEWWVKNNYIMNGDMKPKVFNLLNTIIFTQAKSITDANK